MGSQTRTRPKIVPSQTPALEFFTLQNRFVHIAIAVAMTCSAASNALANPPSMYRFIDDRGVVHFSNVPSDRRYQAIKVLRKVNPPGKEAPKRTIPVNYGYDSLIIREAKANGLEPALVKAVIAAESNFSVKAVSHAGAQGLMQLMPKQPGSCKRRPWIILPSC